MDYFNLVNLSYFNLFYESHFLTYSKPVISDASKQPIFFG